MSKMTNAISYRSLFGPMVCASDMKKISTIKSEVTSGGPGKAETLLESQSFHLFCHFQFCKREKRGLGCFVIVSWVAII